MKTQDAGKCVKMRTYLTSPVVMFRRVAESFFGTSVSKITLWN